MKTPIAIVVALTNLCAAVADAEENILKGYGTVRGVVNGINLNGKYSSEVDKVTGKGKVTITNIPKQVGPGLTSMTMFNVTGVCLIGAKEKEGGMNFGTLTNGNYSRNLAIQAPTGERVHTEGSFIKQPDGRIAVDIVYNGNVPSVPGMTTIPSEHTFIQGENGEVRSAGEMKVKDPRTDKVIEAPIISEFAYHTDRTLPTPMTLILTPIRNVYDPITETITIEVQETIKPKAD